LFVLSTVWLLKSAGSLANAVACGVTVDKRVHFVYCRIASERDVIELELTDRIRPIPAGRD